MKSKIDVAFFQSGDIKIFRVSIYEELWNDYLAFINRAERLQEQGTAKSRVLAERYKRAAIVMLYAFLQGVVDSWIKQLIRSERVSAQVVDKPLQEKCLLVSEYVCTGKLMRKKEQFLRLHNFISRYEQRDLALLEHAEMAWVRDAEAGIDEFLSYMEKHSSFMRFPVPDQSTEMLVQKLGTTFREQ